jgi:hypothetical protein
MFQYKMFSQEGYSSTKYSARKDIPVQNIQPVRIFQYTNIQFVRISQYTNIQAGGYSSTKIFSR